MATYSESQQRDLDVASGAELDRHAEIRKKRGTMPLWAYPNWWMGVLREMSAEQAAGRILQECGLRYTANDVERVAAAMTAYHAIRQERGT